MNNTKRIDGAITHHALEMLEIDSHGLEATDRSILLSLANDFDGGPVGLKSLSATIAEEEETIENVYEPYLMRIGYLVRTSKGRVLTPAGYRHIGLEPKERPLSI
jgi:Holliday junction DNA helicase RuvB